MIRALNNIFSTLINTIPKVFPIILILITIFILFAHIGLHVFSNIMPYSDYDGTNMSFVSLISSLFTLIVIGFGDNCFKIILSLTKQ